jgi:hypothetical protein
MARPAREKGNTMAEDNAYIGLGALFDEVLIGG